MLPTHVWEIPHLSGTIRRGTEPVAGAEVRWSLHDPEQDRSAAAVTNDRGEFELAARKRRVWVVVMGQHALSEWRMLLREGDTTLTLLAGSTYGFAPPSSPRRVVVDCDLALERPCTLIEANDARVRGDAQRGQLPATPATPRP